VKSELLAVAPDDYSPSDAAKAMQEIRGTVKDLERASSRWLEVSVSRHYSKAASRSRIALEILGKKPRKKPYEDHKRRLIDDAELVLRRANQSIIETSAKILSLTAMAAREIAARRSFVQEFDFSQAEKRVASMAAKTVAEEEAAGALTTKVRKYLVSLVSNDQFVTVNGRRYDMKYYSELVAHTTLAESQTAATLDLCDQFENDLVKWSDHQTQCAECAKYEGRTFSISGNHPKYPYLEAEPPIHPNCEHALLPTSDISIAVEKKHGRYQTPGSLIGG